METANPSDDLISTALLQRIRALAAAEHRSATDLVRDAIEGYLQVHLLPLSSGARTAQEAVAGIRERRKNRPIPEGLTIREMIEDGRS